MVILCTELKKGTRRLRLCFAPKDIILNDGTVYDSSYALELPFIEHYHDMRMGKMHCRLRERLGGESNHLLAELEGWEPLLKSLDWSFLEKIDGGVE